MSSITQNVSKYEVAWRMYQNKLAIKAICNVVSKDRSTVYRWIKDIKLHGIRNYLKQEDLG
jgi:transposase-like protein